MHHPGVEALIKARLLHGFGRHPGQDAPYFALQTQHIGIRAGQGDAVAGRVQHRRFVWQTHQRLGERGAQCVRPARLHGDGFHHWAAQLLRQGLHIDAQPTRPGHVGHVECHQHGSPQTLEFEHQTQVHAQVGGIGDGHQQIGHVFPSATAFEHLQRHLFVGGGGVQAVGAGQVDHGDMAAIFQLGVADFALDRHARVVGHFLAGAGQQVEQRSFAAIRVADQGHTQRMGGQARL